MLHHMFRDASLTISLAPGTLLDSPDTKIPTATDNLFSQGIISANEFGIYFEPTTQPEVMNGEITWGQFSLRNYDKNEYSRIS
jgi:hypothetical protein